MTAEGRQTDRMSEHDNRRRRSGSIERFLVSCFFIEAAGHTCVYLPIHACRHLGWSAPYDWVHAIPHFQHILFTLLLVVCIAGNVVYILRQKRR